MNGSIYSDQKCQKCGGSFVFNESKKALICPDHPSQKATGRFYVKFFGTTKRFANDFVGAERHLTGLRFKFDEGSYDPRDYQKNQPLAFKNLVQKYLEHRKSDSISDRHYKSLRMILGLAIDEWEMTNIKEIGEGEIEDFLKKDFGGISNKTRHNYKSALSDFWRWVVRRERRKSGIEMPLFPEISFNLKFRTITSIETQQKILEEVKRLTFEINPRIWLAIKLLSLYPKIRPKEIRNIQEGHINLNENWIIIPHPKEGKPKFVHILPNHAELIRSLWVPRGLPHMYFFRHLNKRYNIKAGTPFGDNLLQRWWNNACDNLGVKGVTMYPGTKHTTVTAAGQIFTPEQIQRGGTGHASNAFKRYMLPDPNEALSFTQGIEKLQESSGKILDFDEKRREKG